MYEQFFGLAEQPFRLTPDTSFYYGYAGHQEALNTLLVALQMGEGFIKVTGEVGTGKTLLCRKLLNELAQDEVYVTAYIPNPSLTPTALKYSLADELGIDYPRNIGQHKIMSLINDRLIEIKARNKRAVLIIDESQALDEDCLEAVRLLTNLETEKSKLLHVVLFGQPELNTNLDNSRIRQLKQRITFSYELTPFSGSVVCGYLAHRLTVAGYTGPGLFDAAICQKIFRYSGGIPRLVNILAHKCLLLAYGEGTSHITLKHLKKAVADTESIPQPSGSWLRTLFMLLLGTGLSTAAAAGVYYYLGMLP
jgi:MSHA biogenesis protein MshM